MPEEKTVVRAAYETMQFFEFDLPDGMTAEEFLETDEFRKEAADRILSGFIDFRVERKFDEGGNEV